MMTARNNLCMLFVLATVFVATLEGLSSASLGAALMQEPGKPTRTVWDGVYAAEQAARGQKEYQEHCTECHATGEAPVLFGEGFMRRWFGESANSVFTKMRTQMPLNTPGSLPESTYLDILSFVLAESGFPAGAEELTSSPERLTSILITEKSGPGGPVPNFSLVQVVGCLTQGADKAWMLNNSSEPIRAKDPGDASPADLRASESTPLGKGAFRLLDYPALSRETHRGHKVQVKGFLIRQPNSEDRLNPTSLQTLADSCAP